jgi:hypothetical protein
MTANVPGVYFLSDENVLKLIVEMDKQLYKYIKNTELYTFNG